MTKQTASPSPPPNPTSSARNSRWRGTINHHDYSQFIKMGGGAKVPYPKHVWSPAGGWYTQPKNWKVNTAVMLTAIFGVTAMAWKFSAENEYRTKFPEQGRFYPSRYWSKQIIEHEKEVKEGKKSESA